MGYYGCSDKGEGVPVAASRDPSGRIGLSPCRRCFGAKSGVRPKNILFVRSSAPYTFTGGFFLGPCVYWEWNLFFIYIVSHTLHRMTKDTEGKTSIFWRTNFGIFPVIIIFRMVFRKCERSDDIFCWHVFFMALGVAKRTITTWRHITNFYSFVLLLFCILEVSSVFLLLLGRKEQKITHVGQFVCVSVTAGKLLQIELFDLFIVVIHADKNLA